MAGAASGAEARARAAERKLAQEEASLRAMILARMSTASIAMVMGWSEGRAYNRVSAIKAADAAALETLRAPGKPAVAAVVPAEPAAPEPLPVAEQAPAAEPVPVGVEPPAAEPAGPADVPAPAMLLEGPELAGWLYDNTELGFEEIGARAGLTIEQVAGIADGEEIAPPAPPVEVLPEIPANVVRYARWFVEARWRIAEVADLFDVSADALRQALALPRAA